jgi:hypothetical protein
MFSCVLPGFFLEEIDPTVRQRHFGHGPVFWAWLAQILETTLVFQGRQPDPGMVAH